MIKKLDFVQIVSVMTIISIMLGVIYFPINAKFNIVNAKFENIDNEISSIKTDLNEHRIMQSEQLKEYARLKETNIKLEQICSDLERLFKAIDNCQEEDAKFRDKFYDFISNYSKR